MLLRIVSCVSFIALMGVPASGMNGDHEPPERRMLSPKKAKSASPEIEEKVRCVREKYPDFFPKDMGLTLIHSLKAAVDPLTLDQISTRLVTITKYKDILFGPSNPDYRYRRAKSITLLLPKTPEQIEDFAKEIKLYEPTLFSSKKEELELRFDLLTAAAPLSAKEFKCRIEAFQKNSENLFVPSMDEFWTKHDMRITALSLTVEEINERAEAIYNNSNLRQIEDSLYSCIFAELVEATFKVSPDKMNKRILRELVKMDPAELVEDEEEHTEALEDSAD